MVSSKVAKKVALRAVKTAGSRAKVKVEMKVA